MLKDKISVKQSIISKNCSSHAHIYTHIRKVEKKQKILGGDINIQYYSCKVEINTKCSFTVK